MLLHGTVDHVRLHLVLDQQVLAVTAARACGATEHCQIRKAKLCWACALASTGKYLVSRRKASHGSIEYKQGSVMISAVP
jgi:hypothetical protein